jgi:tRNA wybutosine-synthesizing protein 3
MQNPPNPPSSFLQKKRKILEQLSIPDTDYSDASPKGSVDEGIRDLIDEINRQDGLVTTSSCAGRVSVYLEGTKAKTDKDEGVLRLSTEPVQDFVDEGNKPERASPGGKGGGEWLFVSHSPIRIDVNEDSKDWRELFGLKATDTGAMSGTWMTSRLIHFKFEPMVRPIPWVASKTTASLHCRFNPH